MTIINALVAFKTAAKVERLMSNTDHTADVVRSVAVLTEKQGAVVTNKLDVIHDLTNSTLAATTAALTEANARIARLEQTLAQQKGVSPP